MLTEMVDYGCKKEEVKTMQSEIKENVKGTNSKVKETRTQINNLEQKEKINIQLEQKQELKKMRRGIGNCRTTLNIPTSES